MMIWSRLCARVSNLLAVSVLNCMCLLATMGGEEDEKSEEKDEYW